MMRKSSHVLMIVTAMAVVVSAGSGALADVTDFDVFGFVADPEDGTNYVGRIAVLVDPKPSQNEFPCGSRANVYKRTVFINPGAGPAAILDLTLTGLPTAGTRLEIVCQATRCDGVLELRLRTVQPRIIGATTTKPFDLGPRGPHFPS